VENLINIAMTLYKGYFCNGAKVLWYYSNMKNRQSGIKIKSSDYFEVEDAYNKLRKNGILLIETNINLIDILEITKSSELVYQNDLLTEFIILK
jgi:hypothetical protein